MNEFKKITLDIAGKEVELMVEEAKNLRNLLNSLFGQPERWYYHSPSFTYRNLPATTNFVGIISNAGDNKW